MLPVCVPRGRRVCRLVNKSHLHSGKTSRSRREDHSAGDEVKRSSFAIHIENETVPQFCSAGSDVVDNCLGIRFDWSC